MHNNSAAVDSQEETRKHASDIPVTPRQTEVLKLIARGMTSREAAAELEISVKTVETHRANLMRRLELHNIAQVVHYAVEHEIVAVLHAPLTEFECTEVTR